MKKILYRFIWTVAAIAAVSAAGCSKNSGDVTDTEPTKLESFTVLDDNMVLYADADKPTAVRVSLTPEDADLNSLKWALPADGQIKAEMTDGQFGLRGVTEGEYEVTVSAEGVEKSQTVKVTVIRRKFTVAATENGENPFDAGQIIYTTKLDKDRDGKSVFLYVRTADGDADMTPEDIGITLKDNILISGDMVEAAADGGIRVGLTLGAEDGRSDFTVTYTENGASYSQDFTLAAPKDITGDFDPDFAEILERSRAIKDKDHITDADAYDVQWLAADRLDGTQGTFKNVESFRGIGHLVNLKSIEFNTFKLSSLKELDLSRNTKLSKIKIPAMESLEILKLPASATELQSVSQTLKDIDFSGCANLESIDVNCTSWENADMSGCRSLKVARLGGESGPAKMDVSGCENLETLFISNLKAGGKLTELRLPKESANLERLHIDNHSLDKITLGDYPSLETLIIKCMLTELDIRTCPGLKTLGLRQNPGKDGKFTVTAWFDDNSIPEDLDISYSSWTASDGTEVTLEFRKAQ